MSAKTPNVIDAAVGRNVRIQRMSKGLSQAQLGARIGVSFQQVQKYEMGINRVGSGRLVRIAGVLKVPPMALFDGVDDGRHSTAQSPLRFIADRQSFRLAQAFSAIGDPAIRRSLVAFVERAAAARPRVDKRKR